MDYWPNIDGVRWFAVEVLPQLRAAHPRVHFTIVGMRPTAAVKALACAGVTVTGTVPDVRPYLQHAAIVVAPLRVARGVQNKILEAMAMARPVVATEACGTGVDAVNGRDFVTARDGPVMVSAIDALLRDAAAADAMGAAARARIVSRYTWDAQLALLESALADPAPEAGVAA
jgi:glycosyltransferase involved in cell wall biosynthesis